LIANEEFLEFMNGTITFPVETSNHQMTNLGNYGQKKERTGLG